eukprot:gene45413-57911_t
MEMRVLSRLMGCALGTVMLVGPALAADPLKAEVIHWWTSEGEAAAVKVFADAFNKAG